MPVSVASYDPGWQEAGRVACAELADVLPGVEHVGSTAVPGLAAKPIIDLMAPCGDLAAIDVAALAVLGYRPGPAWTSPRRLFVREPAGVRTHNLHVVPADGWDTRNQRLLRDHLRTHPDAMARYADRKREIADLDLDDYTLAKTALVQELVDAARDARGLPRVPVWEE